MEQAARGTREQIAFYGSTPAYSGVLEHHGWGELQGELNALSKQGKWKEMGELIDDDMLATFAVVAEPDRLAAGLLDRYAGTVDRISFYAPAAADPTAFDQVRADPPSRVGVTHGSGDHQEVARSHRARSARSRSSRARSSERVPAGRRSSSRRVDVGHPLARALDAVHRVELEPRLGHLVRRSRRGGGSTPS